MSRPLIGITVDENDEGSGRYASPFTYAGAIELAGGLPLLLPFKVDLALIPQYVDLLDGMLFSGGADLNPQLYDETYHPKAQPINPDRQKFELALLAEVERRRMPTLGVCLGSQLMNVHRGGSLNQFLPDIEGTLEHRKIGDPTRHPVRVDTQTELGKWIGSEEVSVNTYHKQSVKKLGSGLRVIATAPDGVIEGFEDPSFPLYAAVQWHPERLAGEKEHLAPFKLLVEKSRKSNLAKK
jgi:putative glutamine amidotransferase